MKRILAIILSLMLIFTMLPTAVLAEEAAAETQEHNEPAPEVHEEAPEDKPQEQPEEKPEEPQGEEETGPEEETGGETGEESDPEGDTEQPGGEAGEEEQGSEDPGNDEEEPIGDAETEDENPLLVEVDETEYTVTWVNADGKEIYKESVLENTVPSYHGESPVYPKSVPEGFIYVFSGQWKPDPAPITKDTTYKAKYVKYDADTNALLDILYVEFDGEDSKEIENTFLQRSAKIGSEKKAVDFKKDIDGYVYLMASQDRIVIEGDTENILVLYYMDADKPCANGASITGDPCEGEELTSDDTAIRTKQSKWYRIDTKEKENSKPRIKTTEVGSDANYVIDSEDIGKCLFYSTKDDEGTLLPKQGIRACEEAEEPEVSVKIEMIRVDANTLKVTGVEDPDANYRWYRVEADGTETDLDADGDTYILGEGEDASAIRCEVNTGSTTEILELTESEDITGKTEENECSVTWRNYDGSVLYREDVSKGTVPRYHGEVPVFPGEIPEEYIYLFSGWDPTPAAITEDTSYKAKYVRYSSETYAYLYVDCYDRDTEELIEGESRIVAARIGDEKTGSAYRVSIAGYRYQNSDPESLTIEAGDNHLKLYYTRNDTDECEVYWTNYNGAELYHELIRKGSVPEYTRGTPVFPGEVPEGYIYLFYSWDPTPAAVEDDTTYKAKYVRYSSEVYAYLNVHCVNMETEEELEDYFVQKGARIGDEKSIDDLIRTIPGYRYVSASEDEITIEAGVNDLYLYYSESEEEPELKGTVTISKIDDTTLQADFVPEDMEIPPVLEYAWYRLEEDGTHTDIQGEDNTHTLTEEDRGTLINCVVTSEGFTGSVEAEEPFEVRDIAEDECVITWTNYDNSVIMEQIVKKGTTPKYPGSTPTFPGDVPHEYIYLFSTWIPEVTVATGDATYKTKYVRYNSQTYAYLDVHCFDITNDVEIENAFRQSAREIGDTWETDAFAESIRGYQYVRPATETVTLTTGTNIINLYYLPIDEEVTIRGVADIGNNLSAIYEGTEAVQSYSWYRIKRKSREEVFRGNDEIYSIVSEDKNSGLYCKIVTESGREIYSKVVYVLNPVGTVELSLKNSSSAKLKAIYTPSEGSERGIVVYTWLKDGKAVESFYNTVNAATESVYTCIVSDSATGETIESDQITICSIVTEIKGGAGFGTVEPGLTVYVEKGTNITIHFKAKSGYTVAALSVDGLNRTALDKFTFKPVDKNHTINVQFSASTNYPTYPTVTDTPMGNIGEDESTGFVGDSETGGDNAILNPDPLLMDVDEKYMNESSEAGKVERVEYYTEDGEEKYALVYVPYEYDSTEQYNILYIVPDQDAAPEDVIGTDELPTELKLVLDNMIALGEIEPLLVAVPQLEKPGERAGLMSDTTVPEAEEAGDGEFVSEMPEDIDSEIVEMTVEELVEQFPQEWMNLIVPTIEATFSTYANAEDPDSFIATRDHRAIAGFSAGAAATWYTFMKALDYTSTLIPISGVNWLNGRHEDTLVNGTANDELETGIDRFADENDSDIKADELEAETESEYAPTVSAMIDSLFNSNYWSNDFYIHALTGSLDSSEPNMSEFINAIHAQNDSPFIFDLSRDKGNISYRVKALAMHDINLMGMYLMNILPTMWPEVDEPETDEDVEEVPDMDDENTGDIVSMPGMNPADQETGGYDNGQTDFGGSGLDRDRIEHDIYASFPRL